MSQGKHPRGGGERLAGWFRRIDLGDQGSKGLALRGRTALQGRPEGGLERKRGLVAAQRQRAFLQMAVHARLCFTPLYLAVPG